MRKICTQKDNIDEFSRVKLIITLNSCARHEQVYIIMSKLFNVSEVTNITSENTIRKQVIDLINEYNHVAHSDDEVLQYFIDLYEEDSSENVEDEIRSHRLPAIIINGKERDGYIPSYEVIVTEHYIDSGSEDYIYTVDVCER